MVAFGDFGGVIGIGFGEQRTLSGDGGGGEFEDTANA
jgi:hypothetical protein